MTGSWVSYWVKNSVRKKIPGTFTELANRRETIINRRIDVWLQCALKIYFQKRDICLLFWASVFLHLDDVHINYFLLLSLISRSSSLMSSKLTERNLQEKCFTSFFFFFLKGNNGDEYLWFGICLTTCSLPSIKEIFFSRVRMLALWLWQLEREKERDVLATPTAKLNSFLKISVK